MSEDFGEEKTPARERLLALLLDGEWHSWSACQDAGGVRYGARLHELRRLGYDIQTRGERSSGYDYRLAGICEPQQKRVKLYLDEADAELLLSGVITHNTRGAVEEALGSFRHNKDKL